MVEPSPQHPKVKSSSPAIAVGNMSLPFINAIFAKLIARLSYAVMKGRFNAAPTGLQYKARLVSQAKHL